MMRKPLPAVLLVFMLVFFLLVCGAVPSAYAADLYWEIQWDYDDVITETLSRSEDFMAEPPGEAWVRQSERQYSRTADGWEEYLAWSDRLPITRGGVDLKFLNVLSLKGEPILAANQLAVVYADDTLELSMTVPGFVRGTDAARTAVQDSMFLTRLEWQYTDLTELSAEDNLLSIWLVDGFLSAVVILVLGILGMTIFFITRMRKVNKFIKEEYSIDNINISELEEEVEKELDELEKER